MGSRRILKKDFTFVDLFAGIGGFYLAMKKYSAGEARCLYAIEINPEARKVYADNFNIEPLDDIRTFDPSLYPAPDVICAGFPCQTFSKAGKQNGFKDSRGVLFMEIIRIINFYEMKERPRILVLENVQNLITHDNGRTWNMIKSEIQKAGYNVVEKPLVLEPVNINIPQLRNRAIILAVRKDIFSQPINLSIKKQGRNTTCIYDILCDDDLTGSRQITEEQEYVIDCWNDFIKTTGIKIIGFPIWSDEFGKNYDVSDLPSWKQTFILKNRALYKQYKKEIDEWLKKWDVRNKMTKTNRKFEWQVNNEIHNLYDGIIQFRTSGVRVKRPTESPALVAMIHLPIIGRKRRTISIREGARLQSFPETFRFDEKPAVAFRQLGNAVNVDVIVYAFKEFINYLENYRG